MYHPQSNAKVERFHRTLHDVLSKKLSENQQTWDLFLNQALAAIRFNIIVSSKFSPFFLLYNRHVVLPVDNLMEPRRKYQGEELHQIALQEQHKSFTLVRKHLKKAKKTQAKYADRGTKKIEFQVNDTVYYRNNQRKGKLDCKWKPYYRIIEKTGPASYVIKNQLDGSTSRVHAEMLRAANIDEWVIPTSTDGRPLCKTAYVIPPEDSSDEESSDTDQEGPYEKLAKKYQKERDDSDEEDNIPLMELAKRLKARDAMKPEENEESNRDSSVDESRGSVEQSIDFDPEVDSGSETESYFDADDAMSVDGVDICTLSNLELGDKASPENDSKN